MPVEQLVVYIGALVAIHLAPGPDNILVVSTAVSQGWRAARSVCLGISCALLIHVLLSILGLSALLAASPVAFEILRWVGVAYLVWLGVQSLRAETIQLHNSRRQSAWQHWRRGLFGNLLNPKAWVFCALFLPQFIDPSHGEVLRQGAELGGVLLVFNFFFLTALALLAGRITGYVSLRRRAVQQGALRHSLLRHRALKHSVFSGRWLMGSVFFGLAVRMVLLENAAR